MLEGDRMPTSSFYYGVSALYYVQSFNGVVEFVNYILVFSRHGWEEDILGLVQSMLLFEYLVEVLPKSMRYKLYFEVLLVFVDEEPLIL